MKNNVKMAKKSIIGLSYQSGRKKYEVDVSAHETNSKDIKYVTVMLSDKTFFDIEVDSEGDVCITASEGIKILFEDENQVCFNIKK